MEDHVRHYLISGRVQGVGYRAFAANQARAMGLGGWTRNLTDGRVEIVACGPSARLGEFEARLRRGPEGSRVEALAEEDWPARDSREPSSFEVRKDASAPCSASSPS